MRPHRPLCAALAVLGLAGVAPAGAAPPRPRPCSAVSDAEGDSVSPSLDIRSGDLAVGRDVVAAFRVSRLEPAREPAAVLGMTWTFSFSVAGVEHAFVTRRTSTGVLDSTYLVDGVVKAVPRLVFDVASSELRWHVPRSAVLPRGAKTMPTGYLLTTHLATYQADEAEGAECSAFSGGGGGGG